MGRGRYHKHIASSSGDDDLGSGQRVRPITWGSHVWKLEPFLSYIGTFFRFGVVSFKLRSRSQESGESGRDYGCFRLLHHAATLEPRTNKLSWARTHESLAKKGDEKKKKKVTSIPRS